MFTQHERVTKRLILLGYLALRDHSHSVSALNNSNVTSNHLSPACDPHGWQNISIQHKRKLYFRLKEWLGQNDNNLGCLWWVYKYTYTVTSSKIELKSNDYLLDLLGLTKTILLSSSVSH